MARPKNCNRCNKPKRPPGKRFRELPGYCECGRPPVMTKDVLQKLRDAFSIGLNDVKSCAYAGICVATLHNYQNKNPKFIEEKDRLRLNPDIKAHQTVVNSLGDANNAWRWLERKDPEFKPVTKIEHGGGMEISQGTTIEMSDEEKAAIKLLQDARRKRIEEAARESNQINVNHNEKLLEAGNPAEGNQIQ